MIDTYSHIESNSWLPFSLASREKGSVDEGLPFRPFALSSFHPFILSPFRLLPSVRFGSLVAGAGPDLVEFGKRGLVELDVEHTDVGFELFDGARSDDG